MTFPRSKASRKKLSFLVLVASAALFIHPFARRTKNIGRRCRKAPAGSRTTECASTVPDTARHPDQTAETLGKHAEQQKALLQAVAHELRTPLSRIRFALEMIDIPEDDEKSKARIQSIDEDLTEIDNLIKALNYFNYVDDGRARLKFETSAVKPLVDAAVSLRAVATKGLRIETASIDDGMTVEADPGAFKTAIGNLIGNAARYAKSRIVITAACSGDGMTIEIAVDDDGQGIPEDKREVIFEPFFSLDPSRSKAMSGFGLGLAIVRSIMKAHSGCVRA